MSIVQNAITLKGSTEIVTEFFEYSINSILYQRGIYPPETFVRTNKYGLGMLVTADDGLKSYLKNVLSQLTQWLMSSAVDKLVVVITSVDTGKVLERWQFDIETDKTISTSTIREKPEKEIMNEIQAIIRQITASVTFLPLLNDPCTFDLLVYTPLNISMPASWEESDPKYIINSQEVRLRSFTTKIHKVDAMCVYAKRD